jgi:hypothetical protein
MAEILAGRADIAVFIDHGRPVAPGIQVAHLQDGPYLAALTRGHDQSRKTCPGAG